MSSPRDIYGPEFIRNLFDEMAKTYGIVNLITSFGFSMWWRKRCIRQADLSLPGLFRFRRTMLRGRPKRLS